MDGEGRQERGAAPTKGEEEGEAGGVRRKAGRRSCRRRRSPPARAGPFDESNECCDEDRARGFAQPCASTGRLRVTAVSRLLRTREGGWCLPSVALKDILQICVKPFSFFLHFHSSLFTDHTSLLAAQKLTPRAVSSSSSGPW